MLVSDNNLSYNPLYCYDALFLSMSTSSHNCCNGSIFKKMHMNTKQCTLFSGLEMQTRPLMHKTIPRRMAEKNTKPFHISCQIFCILSFRKKSKIEYTFYFTHCLLT